MTHHLRRASCPSRVSHLSLASNFWYREEAVEYMRVYCRLAGSLCSPESVIVARGRLRSLYFVHTRLFVLDLLFFPQQSSSSSLLEHQDEDPQDEQDATTYISYALAKGTVISLLERT